MFPYAQKKFGTLCDHMQEQHRQMQEREKSGGSAMPEIGDPFSSGNPNGTHASNVKNEKAWEKRFQPMGNFLKDMFKDK
jgi:hypothetical protein